MEDYILGIESSCDDTSAAVLIGGVVRSNVVAGQAVHQAYGGVVPELASRAHLQNIVPTVQMALSQAGISLTQLSAVACTQAPGLLGSLMVGFSFAKSMAQALKIPLLGVHHMRAHILAHWAEEPAPQFPFLCLTVSGGHTQLVLCHNPLKMDILGHTIDDAAGEAFDKVAKMLALPYPGGPLIDKLAQQGDPKAFRFPIAKVSGLNYSFSGLKTSVLYFLKKQPDGFASKHLKDICASVQHTIVSGLLQKLELAVRQTGVKHIGIAGGVSANSSLRQSVQEMGTRLGVSVHIPAFEYCTDNAAMIAVAARMLLPYHSGTALTAAASPRATWQEL